MFLWENTSSNNLDCDLKRLVSRNAGRETRQVSKCFLSADVRALFFVFSMKVYAVNIARIHKIAG